MKLFVCLIALISLPLTLTAAPKYPFPQNATYKYGIKPKTVDADKVQKAYEAFMKLYEEQGDLARIKHDTQANTVSEGIGYGMLITVYMDNATNNTQAKFDKLWAYYNKFLDTKGLMNWKISGFSGPTNDGRNAATDAELDVAVALLQAYKQWGNEKYLTDAKTLLGNIEKAEIDTVNGLLNPGDSWGGQYNPSYFSTGGLELFKQADSYDWGKILTSSYALLKKCQHATSGLVPDWVTKDGGIPSMRNDVYSYDATRTPWRIAWGYSWYGHQDAKDFCTKIASWISSTTGNDPEKIVDGYNRDGSETGSWSNATFVGPFVCAGMVDEKHQDWLDKGYDFLSGMTETVYYQVSLKILTMLYLSGNMPNFWDMGTGISENGVAQRVHEAAGVSLSSGTTVNFTVSRSGPVSVSLYSVNGQCVFSGAKRECAVGSHSIAINKALPAGSYVVKMVTADGTVSSRAILTR